MKRRKSIGLGRALFLSASILFGGCAPEDCLPEPQADETPPEVRLTVSFTELETGGRVSHTLTAADSVLAVQASVAGEVTAAYVGSDAEGMKRLLLGLSIQETVGVGVQRRAPEIDPITAACPRARLEGRYTLPARPNQRSLLLGAVAENWVGGRTITPSFIVELRRPEP